MLNILFTIIHMSSIHHDGESFWIDLHTWPDTSGSVHKGTFCEIGAFFTLTAKAASSQDFAYCVELCSDFDTNIHDIL